MGLDVLNTELDSRSNRGKWMDRRRAQKRNDESRGFMGETGKHGVVAEEYALVMHFDTSSKLRYGNSVSMGSRCEAFIFLSTVQLQAFTPPTDYQDTTR
jgi:hypothetical protein